ncbi:hypothetical protein GL50803_0017549 [Giardia duodenalis]|uniref:Uncharacterized protein n=1 Tax=Giardia intestinalis (strain ATCC 50803 / WB clone C6) TaxID=184922 RepID=D3KGH7_GIAIC|nr:hypothetical protein GL50803_0017549 [Giardia intestinalis]KAE8305450.1 hypothetical protein GL50803_0017549 [Giardia intestinalis]
MRTLAQDMERTMNALFLDVEFSDWPLLETLMMGYEDAFLGSLENSFVTQLYPSIYGDDFPDIILQNVFPPPKPVVALAGESKFIYSALDSHITGSLHFRMDYIKRHVPKSAALTDKSSALAYEGSGFKQVPQERVPNLPASREEAEKSYFQGFPAKATSTLRKPQPPKPSPAKHLSSNDRLALFNRKESERRSTLPKEKPASRIQERPNCAASMHVLGPLSSTKSAIKYIASSTQSLKDSASLSMSNLSVTNTTAGASVELHASPSNFQDSQVADPICRTLSTDRPAELKAALVVQSVYRMLTRRTWFVTIRLAALAFQAHYRGSLARCAYAERRAKVADRARNTFLKHQEAFLAKLCALSVARRSSSVAYDAFIFSKHKYNEPIVSYFMPVCYDRVERVLFDDARSRQTGALEIRPRKFTVPIVLLSTPASVGGESAILFNSYSTPSMGFSFCPLSLVHFLLDPTVLKLVVVAEHSVSLAYIESILTGITQESMLLKRNQMLHSLLRCPSPEVPSRHSSPLHANKTLSDTPGPRASQTSPTPFTEAYPDSVTHGAASASTHADGSSLAGNYQNLFFPAQLSTLVKTKLVIIHPTLLSTLEANAFDRPVTLSYTGSIISLLLSSPDTIEELQRAVDKVCLEALRLQGSKDLEILPYFSSNIDSVSDFELYALTRTFRLPTTMLLHSQRINCRDLVLTSIHESQIFAVESISELHKYLRNERSVSSDTEYIIAPFTPGLANVFSEAVLYGLAGMRSYCLTRESKHTRRIMLYPILPITDAEQPHERVVKNICSSLGVGDYYILSARKADLQQSFVAARLIIYIEPSERPVVTYLGSSVDISSSLAGTHLPTRSFGTISPAPDSIYFTLKRQSANTIAKLIDYGIHGVVVLHYLYAEGTKVSAGESQHLSNISVGSTSTRSTLPSTASPSIRSPATQSMSVSPNPFQVLSASDCVKVYDSEVAHFNSLLSPTVFGTTRTRPPCSSLNAQTRGDESVSPSINDRVYTSQSGSTAVLVNISFGFTPGICHLYSAMALADLSWDSINGVLSRNDTSLVKRQITKAPMVVLSLPFLWHRDLQTINRTAFMVALMKEGIVFDSLTRTGTLFDWNPASSSFGVFGVYQNPLLAVQQMARLTDITLATIHNAHPTSVSSVTTRLNSLHCESEVNGKAYARLRTAHMSTNLQDCGAALKAMLPHLQPVD